MRPVASQLSADRLLGERLRAERLLAGMEQSALAGALRIDEASIAAYEEGSLRPSPHQLVALAQALEIPMSFFCRDAGQATPEMATNGAGRLRWLALSRPRATLLQPAFACVRSVLAVWSNTRGVLTSGVGDALASSRIAHRMFLVREVPSRSRLLVEQCAPGIAFLRPCEGLAMVGREFHEMPDREYGALMAEAYARAARSEGVHVQAVRALIGTSAGVTLRTRYDRVLMPWRYKGGDVFVMCISLRRERPLPL